MSTPTAPNPAPFTVRTRHEDDGATIYSVPDLGEVARVYWDGGWCVDRRFGPDPQMVRTRRVVTGDYAALLAMRHAESFA